MNYLAPELIAIIAGFCDQSSLAALALTSRRIHYVANPALYKTNVKLNQSSASFLALMMSTDISSLGTLRLMKQAGALFRETRDLFIVDISPLRRYQFLGCPSRNDVQIEATPLHVAAARGHEQVVSFLLSCGPTVSSSVRHPWSPFFLALYFGQFGTAAILMHHSAHISTALGFSSLHIAAAVGHRDAIRLLTQSADLHVNLQDVNGDTPLIYALLSPQLLWGTLVSSPPYPTFRQSRSARISFIQSSWESTVVELLRWKADPNHTVFIKDTWYGPVVLKLFHRRRFRELKRLVQLADVDLNKFDNYGMTVLSWALRAEYGNPDMVEFLLNCGATIQPHAAECLIKKLKAPEFLWLRSSGALDLFRVVYRHCTHCLEKSEGVQVILNGTPSWAASLVQESN